MCSKREGKELKHCSHKCVTSLGLEVTMQKHS